MTKPKNIVVGNIKGKIYNLSDDKNNPKLVIILSNGKIITTQKN